MITSKIFFKSWNGICMYKLKCQSFIYITFDRFDRTFVHYSDLKMEKKKLISISFTEKTEVMHLNEVSSMKTNFLLILSFFVKLNFLLKYLFLKLIGSRFLNWIILLKNDNEWSAKKTFFWQNLFSISNSFQLEKYF